jgi:hypothetical protein
MNSSQYHDKNLNTNTCFVNHRFVHVHQLEDVIVHVINVAEHISDVVESKNLKPEVALILLRDQARKS